ncbi:hypothetical protein DL93DRAFT_2119685 [Clavulina sp. PMI_390]|nr:hypothetical protein DL93DRAFT_2119685 [Clavulina sp. PMI_390]
MISEAELALSSDPQLSKLFVCHLSDCEQTFSGHTGLLNHERAHNNPKHYPCGWVDCERSFPNNYERTRHEATHLKEKQYKCLGCEVAFLRLDQLKQHHTRNNEQSMQCRKAGGTDKNGNRIGWWTKSCPGPDGSVPVRNGSVPARKRRDDDDWREGGGRDPVSVPSSMVLRGRPGA